MIDLGGSVDRNLLGLGSKSGKVWRETTAHPEQQQIQPISMRIADKANPVGPLASSAQGSAQSKRSVHSCS